MKSPFVWFGGKRKVAADVWAALGDVDSYVEPFFGSGAVLLNRPHDMTVGRRRTETINDADNYVCNFWRAIKHDPDQVAYYASDPVNETDLFARHIWLVNDGRRHLVRGLESNPDWYDAKVAGWWVWGVNAWIGSGWCAGTGPWMVDENGDVTKQTGDAGRGVNRKLPHLGDAGRGVNRQLPHLGDAGLSGYNSLIIRHQGIANYMAELAERFAEVRVCNGDWSRIVTDGALSYGATVGVFLDPPYSGEVRTKNLYAHDDHDISLAVREWCLNNGDNPRYRIVLAGYTTEHDHLFPDTWRRHYWSANVSYQTTMSATTTSNNMANRHKECLWMSPHCVDTSPLSLFDVGGWST